MTNPETPTEAVLPAAAILNDGGTDVDALLARVAQQLRRAGRRVRGLVMTYPGERTDCAGPMVMVDIDTRDEYLVSQSLGEGSTACRADPQGFARASQVLRRALEESPDLVICNRFGGLEAEGGGFSAELLEVMSRGVPLLTSVTLRHLDAWQRFSGGTNLLPPREDAVLEWLDRTLTPLPSDARAEA